ncbi:MAG: hypothetical protein M9936_10135 [Caldilinea sp.]|nr:hypothetical protein [Caldilinea sp.]MCB0058144.1 hypothetical protein [Caldilineaceae bacterium]MCB0039869.1 hypothetical protein [Caldilinea sp.]MCB0054402.1 hypothetical protein [Caldilinea sp.]MCB0134789.1 hypothetical protein [Caldilineaceae bacterium]
MSQPTPKSHAASAKQSLVDRLLDPVDRLTEAMYSVLIVLSFTLAFQVSQQEATVSSQEAAGQVSQLFVAALGCAVAWGLIDGIMYIASAMFDRGQDHRLVETIRTAATPQDGETLLAGQLDDELSPITTADERAIFYQGLYARLKGTKPTPVGFEVADFAGALGVALVAIGAAVPVLLPLLFSHSHPMLAVRISNAIAAIMLYAMGYQWGKYVGAVPWKMGLVFLLVALIMLAIAIPLGG